MIKFKNIEIGYPKRTLIKSANIEIGRGELVALIGRNGAGKSTLLRAIGALQSPVSGDIYIGGESIATLTSLERARAVSFVTTERVRIANLKCQDVVALGRAPYTNWLGRMQSSDKEVVMGSLCAVGMESFAMRSIDGLSDGELQRVMIARALAQQTPVVLLDEPTAFLDMPSRYELMKLLRELCENEGKSIIFSTHELDLAMRGADKLLIVDDPDLHILTPSHAREEGVIERIFGVSLG
ncbi:MAG: ABC transporter ATP-binding protein [Rikenellaceae bacterium]